jgi:hypothetical protein
MKKRLIVMTASAMLMLGLTGTAYAGPGADIKDACGTSFGALVSSAKSAGTSAHGSYAGGANAFSNPAILAAHGCAV